MSNKKPVSADLLEFFPQDTLEFVCKCVFIPNDVPLLSLSPPLFRAICVEMPLIWGASQGTTPGTLRICTFPTTVGIQWPLRLRPRIPAGTWCGPTKAFSDPAPPIWKSEVCFPSPHIPTCPTFTVFVCSCGYGRCVGPNNRRNTGEPRRKPCRPVSCFTPLRFVTVYVCINVCV